MNGLSPWLKIEVETLEPVGLAQMMKLALKIKNREVVRWECGLSSAYGGKQQLKLPLVKHSTPPITNDTQSVGSWPMRIITLKGVTVGESARRPNEEIVRC